MSFTVQLNVSTIHSLTIKLLTIPDKNSRSSSYTWSRSTLAEKERGVMRTIRGYISTKLSIWQNTNRAGITLSVKLHEKCQKGNRRTSSPHVIKQNLALLWLGWHKTESACGKKLGEHDEILSHFGPSKSSVENFVYWWVNWLVYNWQKLWWEK